MTILLKRQRGIGLVTAIFLLVVLTAIGVAMVTLTTTQQTSTALDAQGARAYQAARAGAEWGLYQQRQASVCAANTTFAMPAGSSLSGFTVNVACTSTAVVVTGLTTYRVVATACNAPACGAPANANPDYVQRKVDVRFTVPNPDQS